MRLSLSVIRKICHWIDDLELSDVVEQLEELELVANDDILVEPSDAEEYTL